MNKLKWDVCKKETIKDSKGKAKTQLTPIRSIRTSSFVGGEAANIKAFGFDPRVVTKVFTRDEKVQANEFIQRGGAAYHIVRIETYPRHKVLYIEEQVR